MAFLQVGAASDHDLVLLKGQLEEARAVAVSAQRQWEAERQQLVASAQSMWAELQRCHEALAQTVGQVCACVCSTVAQQLQVHTFRHCRHSCACYKLQRAGGLSGKIGEERICTLAQQNYSRRALGWHWQMVLSSNAYIQASSHVCLKMIRIGCCCVLVYTAGPGAP